MSAENTSAPKKVRLMSIDALRGADMLFIMGFSGVVISICKLLGYPDAWLAVQMKHVAWHGLAHHDTIFPLFLFLAGVSWPFSFASQQAKSGGKLGPIFKRIVTRVFWLTLFGTLFGRLLAFNFANVRWDSVLCHIGTCWAGAALVYIFVKSWKWRFVTIAALLIIHWLLHFLLIAPDAQALLTSTDPAVMKKVAEYAAFGTDGFSFTGNISGWFDRLVKPGVMYEGCFDPDGLLCRITGVALCLLGMFAGDILRKPDFTGGKKTLSLFGMAVVMLVLGLAWTPWCPVNKKIWTSSFILDVAAYSFACLALFYWIIDVKGYRKWAFFFVVIGMNSITIYLAQLIVNFNMISDFFLRGVTGAVGGETAKVIAVLGAIAAKWIFLYFLYRKQTFLRV